AVRARRRAQRATAHAHGNAHAPPQADRIRACRIRAERIRADQIRTDQIRVAARSKNLRTLPRPRAPQRSRPRLRLPQAVAAIQVFATETYCSDASAKP
ncbi:hypothetical protein, partial [Lysobacter enzymogenes]|uniref:hypothetical protein n=1 Tax=Lysobacter enzymogenes TaxID=69 RepID=UPI0019D26C75